jgi:glutathione S-transferase
MAAFTLYVEPFYFSPYVFSSFVALREKKVGFDVVEVSLVDGAHRDRSYADAAVTGRVPSLEHDGFRLAESSAIAEYLEEVRPPPGHARLLPEAPRDRARARQLMAWMRSDIGGLRDDRPTSSMFYRFKDIPWSEQGKRDVERLLRVADQLVPPEGGPLFGAWSLVDSELAFMLHRLLLNDEPVPARIAAYAREQWARPSVQEFVQHARPKACAKQYWPHAIAPVSP